MKVLTLKVRFCLIHGRSPCPVTPSATETLTPLPDLLTATRPTLGRRAPPLGPHDKAERRIEISATVSEAVAIGFENKKALPKEGFLVVLRDIAGAGFEPATFGL